MTAAKKKQLEVGALCVLGAAALYGVYSSLVTDSSATPTPVATQRAGDPAPAIGTAAAAVSPGPPSAPRVLQRGRSAEFHPVFLSKRPEERPDIRAIDPTLQLSRFAKLQQIDPAGTTRNLFDVGPPPPKVVEKPAGPDPVVHPFIGPREPAPPAPPAPPLPPPPINLKFYGFSTARANGKRTAYFLDGDDILMATEGDVLKRRYKVIKIGPTSVLVEDTEFKRQQSVPLTEETTG